MNLKNLSNDALIEQLKQTVKDERAQTVLVLQQLQEVESRSLFKKMGYSSIYDFCIQYLGYCEGSAHLRIAGMRLLKTLPAGAQAAAEEKLETGALTLSNLSLLQSFIKTEEKDSGEKVAIEEKIELLSQLENQSKRKVEKMLADKNPQPAPKEKERVVTGELTQITFVADEKLMENFKRLHDLRASIDPSESYAKLFLALTEFYLKTKDPLRKSREIKTQTEAGGFKNNEFTEKEFKENELENNRPTLHAKEGKGSFDKNSTFPERSKKLETEEGLKARKSSRYIPAQVRQAVWQRDQGKCNFQDSRTGRFCHSSFGIEIDHIQAYALGGKNTVENLRLRCKSHNLLYAEEVFGKDFVMRQAVSGSRSHQF